MKGINIAVEFDTANVHVNQLNCYHSRDVHTSLELAVPEKQLVPYLLQEPYNYERNPCRLTKSYLHYLPDVNCHAAIYASPELGLTFHPQLSSRDCATCSFCVEDELIYVSSVYLDITLTVEESAWIRSLTKATSNRKHYLAGIDSNAHSDAWGFISNNPRGGLVEEILFEHGLCLLNEGNAPTFGTARAATCIDIRVASPALATLMSNWKVQQEMHLSDHHLITVNLKVQPKLSRRSGWLSV
jgi:hypothetical protein